MDVPPKDEARREPGLHRNQKLAIEYGLFAFLSNLTGSIWWAEQRKWKLADQIEQEAAR